jgi:hypothetical protein
MHAVASAGVLTVPELGRWRQLTRDLRTCVDEGAAYLVERAWGVSQPRAQCWRDVQRYYAHWYCRRCQQLAPRGLCGQWRHGQYVAWCLDCHLATDDFLPPLHPPALPWGAVLHYARQEPLHFLRRVLLAHQRDQGEPPAHHDDADDDHVELLAVEHGLLQGGGFLRHGFTENKCPPTGKRKWPRERGWQYQLPS